MIDIIRHRVSNGKYMIVPIVSFKPNDSTYQIQKHIKKYYKMRNKMVKMCVLYYREEYVSMHNVHSDIHN